MFYHRCHLSLVPTVRVLIFGTLAAARPVPTLPRKKNHFFAFFCKKGVDLTLFFVILGEH